MTPTEIAIVSALPGLLIAIASFIKSITAANTAKAAAATASAVKAGQPDA